MEDYSRLYARLDTIPAFLIQTIFLLIGKIFLLGLTNSVPISLLPNR